MVVVVVVLVLAASVVVVVVVVVLAVVVVVVLTIFAVAVAVVVAVWWAWFPQHWWCLGGKWPIHEGWHDCTTCINKFGPCDYKKFENVSGCVRSPPN